MHQAMAGGPGEARQETLRPAPPGALADGPAAAGHAGPGSPGMLVAAPGRLRRRPAPAAIRHRRS